MRLMGNPRPAWFLGHLSQIKRAVDLGIGKGFGLIGKWERDAFIVRLQSVLQKNGQFGIPCLPSREHISANRWCPQCGNISGEFPFRALHFPLFWERSKQSGGVPPFYWLVSTNFGRKRDFLSEKCPKPKMPKHWVFWARNARLHGVCCIVHWKGVKKEYFWGKNGNLWQQKNVTVHYSVTFQPSNMFFFNKK